MTDVQKAEKAMRAAARRLEAREVAVEVAREFYNPEYRAGANAMAKAEAAMARAVVRLAHCKLAVRRLADII